MSLYDCISREINHSENPQNTLWIKKVTVLWNKVNFLPVIHNTFSLKISDTKSEMKL